MNPQWPTTRSPRPHHAALRGTWRGAARYPHRVARPRGRRVLSAAVWLALVASMAACAGRGVPETVDPAAAAAAVERTAPDRPLRVVFDWAIMEGEARFNGSGAARIEPPYRARIDLFGPRGEGYLSAALIGDDLRLPPGTPAAQLPAPAMMWAVLGVVSPPEDAVLTGTRVEPEATELYYRVGESRLRYTLVEGRLSSARWDGDGRRMTVRLTGVVAPDLPHEAFFRDATAGMELKLDVEEVHEVEPHPPRIWTPGGWTPAG